MYYQKAGVIVQNQLVHAHRHTLTHMPTRTHTYTLTDKLTQHTHKFFALNTTNPTVQSHTHSHFKPTIKLHPSVANTNSTPP